MRASTAAEVVDRFLELQRTMYAGGDINPLIDLLADDIVWHVPGRSIIAGDYRGRDAVIGYFRKRREIAGGAIAVTKHAQMGDHEVVVQLADGRAVIAGHDVSWRTVGVYRVAGGRIAEGWLVPLDLAAFDRAWPARG